MHPNRLFPPLGECHSLILDCSSSWLNKNGYGLKAYQPAWINMETMELNCFYTIIRYVPETPKKPARIWGIRVHKGLTDNHLKEITKADVRTWRLLEEPGTVLDPNVEKAQ